MKRRIEFTRFALFLVLLGAVGSMILVYSYGVEYGTKTRAVHEKK